MSVITARELDRSARLLPEVDSVKYDHQSPRRTDPLGDRPSRKVQGRLTGCSARMCASGIYETPHGTREGGEIPLQVSPPKVRACRRCRRRGVRTLLSMYYVRIAPSSSNEVRTREEYSCTASGAGGDIQIVISLICTRLGNMIVITLAS